MTEAYIHATGGIIQRKTENQVHLRGGPVGLPSS